VCVCVRVCVCVYMCVCAYVYICQHLGCNVYIVLVQRRKHDILIKRVTRLICLEWQNNYQRLFECLM